MINTARRGYLVVAAEPEHDTWDGAAALRALQGADSVVCLTAYVSEAMRGYADVLLPIGAFGETAGTYVNVAGEWQSFPGVARPLGDARPAWKVLRVLANVLELDGFEYDAPDAVTEMVAGQCGDPEPSARVAWQSPAGAPEASGDLTRVGLVPIYGGDPLVRRAEPLQQTVHATGQAVRVNPATAERLGIQDGARVRVTQQGVTEAMHLELDPSLPDDTLWAPTGLPETAALGAMFGRVAVEPA